jgi:hypothetical protein
MMRFGLFDQVLSGSSVVYIKEKLIGGWGLSIANIKYSFYIKIIIPISGILLR